MLDKFLKRQPTDPDPESLPLQHKGFCLSIYQWRTIGFCMYILSAFALFVVATVCQQLLASHHPIQAMLWVMISLLIVIALAYVAGQWIDTWKDEIPMEVRIVLVPLYGIFIALAVILAVPVFVIVDKLL